LKIGDPPGIYYRSKTQKSGFRHLTIVILTPSFFLFNFCKHSLERDPNAASAAFASAAAAAAAAAQTRLLL
jgi:hypothetical protein